MDLPNLVVILQAALSPNPNERKAAEQSLDQVHLFYFIYHLINNVAFTCFELSCHCK